MYRKKPVPEDRLFGASETQDALHRWREYEGILELDRLVPF